MNVKNKWDKESCLQVAKLCKSKTSFKKNYRSAYNASEKHGWMKDYFWFTSDIEIHEKWNEASCMETALKCKTTSEFRKRFPYVYEKSRINGWLKQYTWLSEYVQEIKWTEEACMEAAKQCGNVTEFRETFYGAYERSKKYGWLKQYTWFENGRRDIRKKVYVVYAYEDVINKKVYVGLTNNLKRRAMEHRKKDYKHSFRKYDKVRDYFEKNNTPMPPPIVLIDKIDGTEAKIMEEKFIQKYTEEGWGVINVSKTGPISSSLGNVGVKWTYEKCKEIAGSCKTRRELNKNYPGAFYAIKINEWDELLPEKHQYCTLTKEECIEYCKNINSIEELKAIDEKIYKRVKLLKIVQKCFPKKVYTEDECRNIALKYHNLTESKRKDPTLAYSIKKNKLTNIVFKNIPCVTYSYNKAKTECQKYPSRTSLSKNCHTLYLQCRKNGWLNDFFPIKPQPNTVEDALNIAKNFVSRDKLRSSCCKAYYILRNEGLLDSVLPKIHGQQQIRAAVEKRKLTKDKCRKKAEECTSAKEFRKKHKTAYLKSKREGWLVDFGFAKITNKKTPPSKETCIEASMKCSTKEEFRLKYPIEYRHSSVTYHMLKEMTWLKRKKYTKRTPS